MKAAEKRAAEKKAAEAQAHPTLEGERDREKRVSDPPRDSSLGLSLEVTGENRQILLDLGEQIEPRKRSRALSGVVETYALKWGVLSTNALACPYPIQAKEIGLDLCRGLRLPADIPAYTAADLVAACTEMMAMLSMVSML